MVVSVDERLNKLDWTCLGKKVSRKDMKAVIEKTRPTSSKEAGKTNIKKVNKCKVVMMSSQCRQNH